MRKLFLLVTAVLCSLGMWAAEVKLVSVGAEATQSKPDFLNNKTYKSADETYSVNLSTNGVSDPSQGGAYTPTGGSSQKDYFYSLGAACDMSAATIANYLKVTASGCKISKIIVRAHANGSSTACLPAVGFVDGLPETSTIGTKNGRYADVIISDQTPSAIGSGMVKRFDNAATLTYTFSTNVSEVYFSKQIKLVALANANAWSSYPASSAQTACIYGIDVYVEPDAPACAATAPSDITKGELTEHSITLTAGGEIVAGDTWYWQSAEDGTSTDLGTGATKTVSAAGTYYIRSYNASADCWSAAKSITLEANDFKERYAVTYNKGANGTGSIEAGEKIEGEDFTLSSKRFTRDGYVQIGWATSDGGEKAYSLGGTYTEDAAIELFPVWLEAESYVFSVTAPKSIATLKAEGWSFNTDVFDADPTDTEAYANLVSAFINVSVGTSALKNNKVEDMDDNAIALAKNTDAYAIYDLGKAVKVVDLEATLYGGSSSAFDQKIQYIGADGSTVKKEYTNSLKAGNWKANSISKSDAVEDVQFIKIYGASKWVVMTEFSVAYVSKYTITFAAGEGTGEMDAVAYYAGDDVVLPASTFTAPENKVFAAWSSEDVAISDGQFVMPAKNVAVTATYAQTYAISVATGIVNGNVSADKARAVAGETITLSVTPESGYKLSTLVVKDAEENSITVSDNKFTMPASNVTVTATFEEDEATALDNTNAAVKAVKVLRGGQLLIEKNGKTYNAFGQFVR